MSTPNTPRDGGPAFPYGQRNFTERYSEGMTLRDYFAAAALQGMIASGSEWDGSTEQQIAITQAAQFSMAAYAFSDAMLAERAKGGGK